MILELALFSGLFHHKHKQTQAQKDWDAEIKLNHDYVEYAAKGAKIFEEDKLYAQYERTEIDEFESQIYICMQDITDKDEKKLDKDTDILQDIGLKLMSLDHDLHKEFAI